MNVLLLSNSAPNYFNFFNAIARSFAADGATITVAVDSTFSREENLLDTLGFKIHDFSKYFTAHKTDLKILESYSEFNLNGALLSDFERAQIYGIWGTDVNIDFFDRLKSALLSYFELIFTQNSIDIVIYENVSNTFSHFALYVAQKRGAAYLGIGGSRLPGRFSVTSDPLSDDETAKAFLAIRTDQTSVSPKIRQWASDYIAKIETTIPDYMKINGLDQVNLFKRYFRYEKIKKTRALLRHALDKRTDSFQIGNPLLTHLNLFSRNLLRRLKVERVRRLYDKKVNGESFFLYPMHFHPESSTSILAGTYLNEYEVIRNIAFNLPEGYRLYIKDHVSAWGYPSMNFYQKIKLLPNVRLLAPDAPTKQLIKQSRGVITLTSTVGYEALLLKKRVYLFGTVFYDFHKGVVRIENPAKLRETLKRGIATAIDWGDSYNNDFVCAYHAATLPGSLNLMQGPEEAARTAQHVYTEIKKKFLMKS